MGTGTITYNKMGNNFVDGFDIALVLGLAGKWMFAYWIDINVGYEIAVGGISILLLIIAGLGKWEQWQYYKDRRNHFNNENKQDAEKDNNSF
jgi:hypothetical protein